MLARRAWIETLDDYAFLKCPYLLVDDDLDLPKVRYLLRELRGMPDELRRWKALGVRETQSALDEVEKIGNELTAELFLDLRIESPSGADKFIRHLSARKVYVCLATVPY